ncbi:MAG TPA: hypothetical protein VK867_10295, partial [Candidatus Limnocylindrales bacterium]|nr:hypothetical protein [Candidatus Limnocylindrales bacterium]
MIVVIGNLLGRPDEAGHVKPAGFAAAVAVAGVRAGSKVQVVARVGEDAAGDGVMLGLAADGVGHVATLRDAGHETPVMADDVDETVEEGPEPFDAGELGGPTLEAADVGLALRYLTDYRVIVVAHAADAGVVREAASAAMWAGAHLVVVDTNEADLEPASLPDGALVLAAQPDAEGLAARLGLYAATVDSGGDADTAYAVL